MWRFGNFCTFITTVYTTAIYLQHGDFSARLTILHMIQDSTLLSLAFSRNSFLQPGQLSRYIGYMTDVSGFDFRYEKEIFPPFQTGSRAHPASYTDVSPRIKRPELEADQPRLRIMEPYLHSPTPN
jgi:hypothetical protein